jgi:hypothetical protein
MPKFKISVVIIAVATAATAAAYAAPGGGHGGNQSTQARIAAAAGWHHGHHDGSGWWRHRYGGYGWVGPLYWPFAYDDFYDYVWWGYDYADSFWGYGYDGVYAALFAPYGYDDLAAYLPQYTGSTPRTQGQTASATAAPNPLIDQLAQMCGEDSRDIAGLPINRFQQAIHPNDAQGAALDDIASASVKAAQDIKAACPTDVALTAPGRLANMQRRVEAMVAAVATVQPPLNKFYDLLSDEQKARLTALGQDRRQSQTGKKTAGSLVQTCGVAQSGVPDWPTAEIERRVRPTEAQSARLVALQNATAKAGDILKDSCQPDNALTPPARLAAVGKRLDIMLMAVKMVGSALNDFYGTLSDEQKVSFETINPQQASQADQSTSATPTHHRRHRIPYIGNVLRRLILQF